MLPENQEIALIFSIVRSQWVTAGANNMPVDMNIPAILEIMNLYEIKNPQEMFMRILNVGRRLIAKVNDKAK